MKEKLLTDMRYCIFSAGLLPGGIPEFVIVFRPGPDGGIPYAAVSPRVFKQWACFNKLPQELQEGIEQLALRWLTTKRLSGELLREYSLEY